jgi:cyclic pyranopterin phosphate synthase
MSAPLADAYGRVHTYVRVSVTDRCNYRCVYCMPEEGMSWLPRKELLTYEEIARVVGVLARAGVTRVRLTGGEPTVRRDIVELVRAVASVPGIHDVALTTNGHTLASMAVPLREAGLRRVNVSLDSLDAGRFADLTRGGSLTRVLAGIEAARAAGLLPIKINMVVMAGKNDDEVVDVARHFAAHAEDTVVRFIEYMPFGERWHGNTAAAVLRERLADAFGGLSPVEGSVNGAGPACYWRVGPGPGALTVGFISPITEHFCATCNRLRLLADGHLRTCLAHEDTPSLREALRAGESDDALEARIRAIVLGKPEGHTAHLPDGRAFEGVMTGIGG